MYGYMKCSICVYQLWKCYAFEHEKVLSKRHFYIQSLSFLTCIPQFCRVGHSGHENGKQHQGGHLLRCLRACISMHPQEPSHQLLIGIVSCKEQQAPAMFIFGMDIDLVILGHSRYACMSMNIMSNYEYEYWHVNNMRKTNILDTSHCFVKSPSRA